MKYLKSFEKIGKSWKYNLGDYVVLIETPNGKNKKNSYTIIAECREGHFADYVVITYDILTGRELENFPAMEYEIDRLMTPEEIKNIDVIRKSLKYNL